MQKPVGKADPLFPHLALFSYTHQVKSTGEVVDCRFEAMRFDRLFLFVTSVMPRDVKNCKAITVVPMTPPTVGRLSELAIDWRDDAHKLADIWFGQIVKFLEQKELEYNAGLTESSTEE